MLETSLKPARSDLYIIGLGVKVPEHITIQATKAMEHCARIFSIVQEPPRLWLPAGTEGRIEVVNALSMYRDNVPRSENYESAAFEILTAAQEGRAAGQAVGYVTYGNPMVFDSVAQGLVRSSQDAGIRAEIIPGICSVDTILCDLTFDMAPGIQIYEASWLVTSRTPLEVTAPAILFQIGSFGSLRSHYGVHPDARSLGTLVEYLDQFYPRSHMVFVVMSPMLNLRYARIRRVPLEGLCDLGPEAALGGSMYIPALRPAQSDPEFIAGMMSR